MGKDNAPTYISVELDSETLDIVLDVFSQLMRHALTYLTCMLKVDPIINFGLTTLNHSVYPIKCFLLALGLWGAIVLPVSAENMLTPGWVLHEGDVFTELHRPDFPDFRIFSLGLVAPFNAEDETAYLHAFDQMKTQWSSSARCEGLKTAETKTFRGGLVEAWSDPEEPRCRLMGLNLAPVGFFGAIIFHPENLNPTESAFKATTKAAFETLWDAGYQASGQSGPYRSALLDLKDPMTDREEPVDFLIVRMKVVGQGGGDIINRAFPIFSDGTVLTCSHWDPAFLDKSSMLLSPEINCLPFEIKENPEDKSLLLRFSEDQTWENIFVQLAKIYPGSDSVAINFEMAQIGIARPFASQTVDYQTAGGDMTPYLDDVTYIGPSGSYALGPGNLILSKSGRFASGSFGPLGHSQAEKSTKGRGNYKFDQFHVRIDLSSGEKYVGFAAWWDEDATKTEPDDKSHILMFGTVFNPCTIYCRDPRTNFSFGW